MSEWLKSKLNDGEDRDIVAATECISKCQTDRMCSCILMFGKKTNKNKIVFSALLSVFVENVYKSV